MARYILALKRHASITRFWNDMNHNMFVKAYFVHELLYEQHIKLKFNPSLDFVALYGGGCPLLPSSLSPLLCCRPLHGFVPSSHHSFLILPYAPFDGFDYYDRNSCLAQPGLIGIPHC